MLKRIPVLRLLTCLTLLCASAYVPPAYASSADIIIMQVQAGGVGAATQELVSLYNNSDHEVDMTGWCLRNKSAVVFACFDPGPTYQSVYLPAHSFAPVASQPFADYMGIEEFSVTYSPANATSGSIVGSNDILSLVNSSGAVVDSFSWSSSWTSGMVMERSVGSYDPFTYLDTDMASDWQVNDLVFLPYDQTELRGEIFPPFEPGPVVTPPQLVLTELLPNAVGNDEGQEFIEIFNPSEDELELIGYAVRVGPDFDKSFELPLGTIEPLSYKVFSNLDIPFSLLNSSSRVQLMIGDVVASESPSYVDPQEGYSWALFGTVWQYTNQPTPGATNLPPLEQPDDIEEVVSLKPCAQNQYRSPETNRCRLVVTSGQTLAPCKDNQYRSEETNRCRNIASDSDEPAPCKEGQERNPETNRCRNVTVMPPADYGVLGVQTSGTSNNWYVFAAIGGVLALALSYGAWEWRREIVRAWSRLTKFVRLRK